MAKTETKKNPTTWASLFKSEDFRDDLCHHILPDYMMTTRWYAAKTQKAKSFKINQEMAF